MLLEILQMVGSDLLSKLCEIYVLKPLTTKQCTFSNAPLSTGSTSIKASSTARPSRPWSAVHYFGYVHEDDYLFGRLWLFRRSCHLASSELVESRISQLAEAPRTQKVGTQCHHQLRQPTDLFGSTILKGIPTNAQLTITLLRIGEANKAPLPPPPRSDGPPPEHPKDLDHNDLTLDASSAEVHEAIHADTAETTATEEAPTEKPKHRHGSRILGFFKGTTKTGVEAKLGVDKVRAAAGSSHAKDHLGVLPKPEDQVPTGPVDFKARYKGKKGFVFISTSEAVPCVSFTLHSGEGVEEESHEARRPVFSIPIRDIRELKKVGGIGWKAKIVIGWATDKQVADGLEIVDKNGETWRLTAIQLREELFNRLVAMGPQKWESW